MEDVINYIAIFFFIVAVIWLFAANFYRNVKLRRDRVAAGIPANAICYISSIQVRIVGFYTEHHDHGKNSYNVHLIDCINLTDNSLLEHLEVRNLYDINDTIKLYFNGDTYHELKDPKITDNPNHPNIVPKEKMDLDIQFIRKYNATMMQAIIVCTALAMIGIVLIDCVE